MDAKERALQFLNKAEHAEDLMRHYYNDQGELIAYIIGASIAQQIIRLRDAHKGGFSSLDPILELGRFGENKLSLLIKSFDESYLKQQAKLKLEQQNNTLEEKQHTLDQKMNAIVRSMFTQVNSGLLKANYLHLSPQQNSDSFKLENPIISIERPHNPIVYKEEIESSPHSFICSFLDETKQFQLRIQLKLSV